MWKEMTLCCHTRPPDFRDLAEAAGHHVERARARVRARASKVWINVLMVLRAKVISQKRCVGDISHSALWNELCSPAQVRTTRSFSGNVCAPTIATVGNL